MEGPVVSYQDGVLDGAVLRVGSPHQCVLSLSSSLLRRRFLLNVGRSS